MLGVTRVDSLGTVSTVKVAIESKPGDAFQDRHTDLFSTAGEDGRFVYDGSAFLEILPHGLTGADQRLQIRPLVPVDRRRNSDDEYPGARQFLGVGRELELFGGREFGCARLESAVPALA